MRLRIKVYENIGQERLEYLDENKQWREVPHVRAVGYDDDDKCVNCTMPASIVDKEGHSLCDDCADAL